MSQCLVSLLSAVVLLVSVMFVCVFMWKFFFSSRRRPTGCALVTGVQTFALPIWFRRDRVARRDPRARRLFRKPAFAIELAYLCRQSDDVLRDHEEGRVVPARAALRPRRDALLVLLLRLSRLPGGLCGDARAVIVRPRLRGSRSLSRMADRRAAGGGGYARSEDRRAGKGWVGKCRLRC